jgi:VWFA-related protein
MFFMGARLALVTIVAALACTAQETPVFKTGAALVRVDVQVTEKGKPVAGLTPQDFVLLEQGVPRAIEYFGREAEPLQIVLLLDASGSMGKMLGEMAAVARRALGQLQPADRVAIFVFARRAEMRMELADDLRLAERTLMEAPMEHDLGAGTLLNEAVLSVTGYLRGQPPFAGRRAVVVLTDNRGMHFKSPDENVIRSLLDSQSVLNAIVPARARPPVLPKGANINPDFTPANVFRLAEESGGEVLAGDRAGDQFREMIERIRLRYSLGIKAADAPPGTFRRLQVELAPEAAQRHPKALVRARAGYYAP